MPETDPRAHLRADCSRCAGLCCTVPGFARSADFAFDKPPRQPCRHLGEDFRCGVHASLRDLGMPGCTVFDCFGAGQHVVQVRYGGRDWRTDPTVTASMFDDFGPARDLHELRWLLAEADERATDTDLRDRAGALDARVVDTLAHDLAFAATSALREETGDLLRELSRRLRADRPAGRDLGRLSGDLVGAHLAGADLRAGGLRGALLLGADLTGADLRDADLLGADLRGVALSGADLSTALFLTQPQVAAATGDARTRLPAVLRAPGHWGADA